MADIIPEKNSYPKFSIIVPVYNCEKYIAACLNSIFSQKYENYELLVIDDGSSDSSAEIVMSMIKGKTNCTLIMNSHGGVCKARNTGIDLAAGDYMCLVDSDDIIYEDYLSELSRAISDYDPDVIYFYTKYGVNDAPRRDFSGDNILPLTEADLHILSKSTICHTPEIDNPSSHLSGISSFSAGGQAYRLSMLKDNNIRFTEGVTLSEDGLLNLEIMAYVKSGVIVRKQLYNYRTNNISATRSYHANLISMFAIKNSRVKEIIYNLYNNDSEYLTCYYCGLIYQIRVLCENNLFNPGNPLSFTERNQQFLEMIDLPDYSKAIEVCQSCYIPSANVPYLEFAKARSPQLVSKHISQKYKPQKLRTFAKRILNALHIKS